MPQIIFLLILLLVVYGFARGSASLAPWVPTHTKDYVRINRLITLADGQVFLDMGCGTAGLLIYLAKHNPQGRFIGVEIAWHLYIIARIRAWASGLGNLSIVWHDIFTFDISSADVLFVYGYPRSIKRRLTEKLIREAKVGARLFSYVFKFHELPLQERNQPDQRHVPIYVYRLRG